MNRSSIYASWKKNFASQIHLYAAIWKCWNRIFHSAQFSCIISLVRIGRRHSIRSTYNLELAYSFYRASLLKNVQEITPFATGIKTRHVSRIAFCWVLLGARWLLLLSVADVAVQRARYLPLESSQLCAVSHNAIQCQSLCSRVFFFILLFIPNDCP